MSVYIKFVQKKGYANDLLNGKFFCQTPKHYRDCEDDLDNENQKYGRADKTEGNIHSNTGIYLINSKNKDYVYSMMRLDDMLISEGRIVIPQEDVQCMIKEFDSNYAVVLNGPKLESVLTSNPFDDNVAFVYKDIIYRNLSMREMRKLLKHSQKEKDGICQHNISHLFHKPPIYAYQHEWRIVFNDLTEGPQKDNHIFQFKDGNSLKGYIVDLTGNDLNEKQLIKGKRIINTPPF